MGVASVRWVTIAFLGALVGTFGLPMYSASAQNDTNEFYRYYAGAAISWVHHSGYVPHSPMGADTQEYGLGGKAFAGIRLDPSWQLEVTYYYLGETEIAGLSLPAKEQSYAVSGSVLYLSPPMPQFFPRILSWHVLGRLGVAHKWITQTSDAEKLTEGTFAAVFGVGAEFRLTPQLFARFEYEHLSTAIGGPRQSVPALKGLFRTDFGGTENVINVMHTPLSFTLGVNF